MSVNKTTAAPKVKENEIHEADQNVFRVKVSDKLSKYLQDNRKDLAKNYDELRQKYNSDDIIYVPAENVMISNNKQMLNEWLIELSKRSGLPLGVEKYEPKKGAKVVKVSKERQEKEDQVVEETMRELGISRPESLIGDMLSKEEKK